MTIFEDFTIAIAQPSRYSELLKRKKGLYIAFVCILVFLTSLANVVYPSVNMLREAKSFYDFKVPDFTIENGVLTTDKELSLDIEPFILKMSGKTDFTQKDASNYSMAILLGKNNIVIKNNTGTAVYEYKEAGPDFKIDKNDIYVYKDIFVISVIITDVILFVLSFGVFFLGAFFVQLLTKSFLKNIDLKLSKSEHFKLCVYSRAMPSLISAILLLLGFGSFYIAGLMVSVVYIYRVLINMKENKNCNSEE